MPATLKKESTPGDDFRRLNNDSNDSSTSALGISQSKEKLQQQVSVLSGLDVAYPNFNVQS